MNISRREYIKACIALTVAASARSVFANEPLLAPTAETAKVVGNFAYIYGQPQLRDQFVDFYTNVFHLYPEQEMHKLVNRLTLAYHTDDEIYQQLQAALPEIEPFLSSLRYALPALAKQKAEMTRQTVELLDQGRRYNGYMEIGTTGRYLSQLEDQLQISDERYLLHTTEAGYGPQDIIERGQLSQIGSFVDMGDYSTEFTKLIAPKSLDLVTVYIGFHHCPLHKREDYIASVIELIRPGGKLILRDHDAHNEDMRRVAALAHDTFNAGTQQSLESNKNELRHFYSHEFIIDTLQRAGLRHDGKILFQPGDPTRNGLMAFTRV